MKNWHSNMTDQKHARRAARGQPRRAVRKQTCRAATLDVDTDYTLLGTFPGVIAGLIFQYARPWTLKEKVVEIFDGKKDVLTQRRGPLDVMVNKWRADSPTMFIDVSTISHVALGTDYIASIHELLDILDAGGSARYPRLTPEVVAIIKCQIDKRLPD